MENNKISVGKDSLTITQTNVKVKNYAKIPLGKIKTCSESSFYLKDKDNNLYMLKINLDECPERNMYSYILLKAIKLRYSGKIVNWGATLYEEEDSCGDFVAKNEIFESLPKDFEFIKLPKNFDPLREDKEEEEEEE